jgi:hypothetical protein
MPDSLLPDSVKPGDPIRADVFTRLLRIGKIFNQEPGQFNSGTISVQRPLGLNSGTAGGLKLTGDLDTSLQLGLIVKQVPAKTTNLTVDGSGLVTDVSITPGVSSDFDCVVPLLLGTGAGGESIDAETGHSFSLVGEKDSDSNIVRCKGINLCWEYAIYAGNGQAVSGGDGTYNDAPVYCLGFQHEYKDTISGNQKKEFYIIDVVYDVEIWAGLTTAAVSGGNFDIDGVSQYSGPKSARTKITGVINPDSWHGPDNGYALVMRSRLTGDYKAIDLKCIPAA